MMPSGGPIARCALVWALVSAACTGAVAWLWPIAVVGPQPGFEQALTVACAWTGIACAGWLLVLTSLTAIGTARGTVAVAGSRGVRRLLLLACGAALVAGTAAPSEAVSGTLNGHHHPRRAAVQAVQGLPLPELPDTATRIRRRPTTPAHEAPTVPGPTAPTVSAPAPEGSPIPATGSGSVVVRRGDSLWVIASASLPPGASNAQVARAWQQIYALNAHVIGSDPDLIEPGQVLALPLSEG